MATATTSPLVVLTRRRLLASTALAVPALLLTTFSNSAGAVAVSNVSGTVNASAGLNLRTGPGTGYRIIRTLPNGTRLTISETSGDWFKVTVSGTVGWVISWWVTLLGTASTTIHRGNTARKMIALTFDAGSDLGYTDRIINTLVTQKVVATFGPTGTWVKSNPNAAKRIVNSSFPLINHTVNHPSFTGYSHASGPISPARRLTELITAESYLRTYAGAGAKPYWRPPYGDYDAGVLRDTGAAGYSRTVLWTVDSLGWRAGVTEDQIFNTVTGKAGNGMIALFHVGSASRDALALERIIRWFKDRGYAFGTVAQVIA